MIRKLLLSIALLAGLVLAPLARAQEDSPVAAGVDLSKSMLGIWPPLDDQIHNFWHYDITVYMAFSEKVAINPLCTEPIRLRYEEEGYDFVLPDDDFSLLTGIYLVTRDSPSGSSLPEGVETEVTLKFTPDIDGVSYFEEGHYNLTIPEGFFTVNDVPALEFKASWHKYSLPFDEISVYPHDKGTETTNLQKLKITVPWAESVACQPESVTVTNAKGERIGVSDIVWEPNSLFINLVKPLRNGSYSVSVAPGALVAEDNTVYEPAIAWTFDVHAPYAWTINPPKGYVTLNELRDMTIVFSDTEAVVTLGSNPDAFLKVSGVETKYDISVGDAPNEVKFTLRPYETDKITVVKFIVGAGSFMVDGEPNEEISINYWLKAASVGTLPDETREFDVYTPDGICFKRGATAADIEELSPGLYIVNGRKIVIR